MLQCVKEGDLFVQHHNTASRLGAGGQHMLAAAAGRSANAPTSRRYTPPHRISVS